MKAEHFLNVLRDAMPSRDTLEEYGLDEDEIEEIQATFLARARSASSRKGQSEVERLITEFDCSRVEVGLVRFLDEPRERDQGIQFACCEADSIVVKEDGSVAMYDEGATESKEVPCATDSQKFLEGLAAFIEIRANKSHWKGRVDEAATRCAAAAGGGQSEEFFRILCGFLR
jgi:hypothetical protein